MYFTFLQYNYTQCKNVKYDTDTLKQKLPTIIVSGSIYKSDLVLKNK